MALITPAQYICYRAVEPLTIDGHLNEDSWIRAPRTPLFVDIEGDAKPLPRLGTRVMMLWDNRFFYLAADMEEPHVWGTLTERDSVIFHDNDFEIFIDPDNDSLDYMEFEMNALNTVWDLCLPKQYNRGGAADNSFDFVGIRHAVQVDGTLNCSDDVDRGWTAEIAIPGTSIQQYSRTPCPPAPGDRWRLNFSRVEWEVESHQGGYRKKEDLPCANWVWSPQGVVNMHEPHMWGYVQFSGITVGEGLDEFSETPEPRLTPDPPSRG